MVASVVTAGLALIAAAPATATAASRAQAAPRASAAVQAAAETICTDNLPTYQMTATKVQETIFPTYHQDWPGGTVDIGDAGCQVTITRPSYNITITEVGGDPWKVAVKPGSGYSSVSLKTVYSPNCTAPAAIARVAGNRPSCSAGLISTEAASTASLAVTAVPNPVLNVSLTGNGLGTVSSSTPGINCGADCVQQVPLNTQVTLTASHGVGSSFDGWTGAPGCAGSTTCVVTMSQSRQVSATFVADGTNNLTVVKGGTGTGTVTSSPAGINCGATCSSAFSQGLQVVLTATPSADSQFVGWSGSCAGNAGCVVTMDGNRTVIANFALRPVPTDLTVTKNGSGSGSVTSTPAGIDCGATCVGTFDSATVVQLQAVPDAGSFFTGWSSGGCAGTDSCTVTLVEATEVFATFTAITHRPDALIGMGAKAPLGDGVYNTTAAGQEKSKKTKRGKTAVFTVTLQNDGSVADIIGLKQKATKTKGFQVAYLIGAKNVTKKVVQGKYTKTLDPLGTVVITVAVTVQKSAKSNAAKKYLLTAVSKLDGTKKDAVRAIVTAK